MKEFTDYLGECLFMIERARTFQDTLRAGYKTYHPTIDGNLHSDYCRELQVIQSQYYEEEQVDLRRDGHSNIVGAPQLKYHPLHAPSLPAKKGCRARKQ